MPDNCNPNNCPVNTRVDGLEKELDRLRENSTETHRQIFNRLGELQESRAASDEKLDNINSKLDALSETVNGLAGKSGKMWDNTVWEIIKFVLQAALVIVAVKIGLK